MSFTILTVDDSKAVRIIVKKAFKNYDCKIIEACDGAEGLAKAVSETPDLIILDVNMPVMDGVEMLTKKRENPSIRSIPVIMLTTEGSRDTVLKIAKLGIRDYIVKPFKEEVLVEKVGKVLKLEKVEADPSDDPDVSTVLVVDDKQGVLRQFENGMGMTEGWVLKTAPSESEAIVFCETKPPDVMIVSLSLKSGDAHSLFRQIKSNETTKYMPILGLSVKIAVDEQKRALELGFHSIITKPINFTDVGVKLCKALNKNASGRYFEIEDDEHLIIRVPADMDRTQAYEISGQMRSKIADAVDEGVFKVIMDLSAVKVETFDMKIVKVVLEARQVCLDMTVPFFVVAGEDILRVCEDYEDSKSWIFFDTIEDAKNSTIEV